MLERRRLLQLLALGLVGSWAKAEEGKDSEGDTDDKKEDPKKDDRKKEDTAKEDRPLYAEVTLAQGGAVVTSGGRLESDSPWMPFLLPGMWVRAEGNWRSGSFYAKTLEVAQPQYFSYCKGPAAPLGLGQGWVEVWHTAAHHTDPPRRLALRPVAQGREVVLLVCAVNGTLVALPKGLPPIPNPPQGWVLARGAARGNAVVWQGWRAFP